MTKRSKRNYELTDLGIRVFYVLNERVPVDQMRDSRYFHKHGFYELHIVLGKECVLQTDDGIYSVGCGQFALIAPGIYHKFSSDTAHDDRYCISFELSNRSEPTAEKLYLYTKENPVWVGDACAMLDVVRRLQSESGPARPFSNDIRYMLNRILVLDLLREMETSPVFSQTVRNSLDEERNLLIDIFLNTNFHLSAGEETLAKYLGLSRRQLSRILNRLYGKSYRKKVMEIRGEVACDLLCHSNLSIQEISEHVGYSTPSNFIAFFKSEKGITPAQYREKNKKL